MASSPIDNNEGPNPANKLSTTFVQANPSNFRAVVQKLTGVNTLRKSGHKLQERKKTIRKLEITMNNVAQTIVREKGLMASPVSTLDACGTTMDMEEEKAIGEKGYYLHPSPIREYEPKLLVLFPLSSPTNDPSSSS